MHHQSSIVNHHSSIINHHSSIIYHQSTSIHHPSSIIHHHPSSIIQYQSSSSSAADRQKYSIEICYLMFFNLSLFCVPWFWPGPHSLLASAARELESSSALASLCWERLATTDDLSDMTILPPWWNCPCFGTTITWTWPFAHFWCHETATCCEVTLGRSF